MISRCVQWRTSNFGHTCLQEQLTEITEKTSASPSRKGDEQEKGKKTRMAIANFFALRANSMTRMALQSFLRYTRTQKIRLKWQGLSFLRYTQKQKLEWQLENILRYTQTQ